MRNRAEETQAVQEIVERVLTRVPSIVSDPVRALARACCSPGR